MRRKAFKRLVASHPDFPWTYLDLGWFEAGDGNHAAARVHFEEAQRRGLSHPHLSFAVADSHWEEGNKARALMEMDAAIDRFPGELFLMAWKTEYLYLAGKVDAAVALAQQVIARRPHSHNGRLVMVQAGYKRAWAERSQGAIRGALQAYRSYLDLWPSNDGALQDLCEIHALAHEMIAPALVSRKESQEVCVEALRRNPDSYLPAYILHVIYQNAPVWPVHVVHYARLALAHGDDVKPRIRGQLEANVGAFMSALSGSTERME